MDDPRAPHTLLKTDDDLRKYMPLSAMTFGVTSLRGWTSALRSDAAGIQSASLDPKDYIGLRVKLARVRRRIGNLCGANRGQHK